MIDFILEYDIIMKKELIGPRQEPEVNDMRDVWYGYTTARMKNSGLRGVPEYHNRQEMKTYEDHY